MSDQRTRQRVVVGLVAATALIHLIVGFARSRGWIPLGAGMVTGIATAWGAIIFLATIAARQIMALQTDLRVEQDRVQATLTQIEQLATLNEMLLTLGRSKDVGLAFQSLARHVGRLSPCDRLGLALLRASGQEVLTYSARVSEPERRRRPRPEMEFSLERSIFGRVIRTCEALVLPELSRHASDFHDAAMLVSQGFQSALVLPLISRNRAIGALMMLSRQPAAFTDGHRDAMQPLAEVLAFAFVAQQQQQALDKFQIVESMSETTISLASEVNGALQGVIGETSILRGQHPELMEGLDAIMGHAERISELLERMRTAAQEQFGEGGDLTAAIPASPEAFGPDENF